MVSLLVGCGGDSESRDGDGDWGDGLGNGSAGNGNAAVESAACSVDFSPCGGDVVGTWELVEYCGLSTLTVSMSGTELGATPGCEDMWEAASVTGLGGTMTFRSDGTVVRNLKGTMALTSRLSPACAEGLGIMDYYDSLEATCAAMQQSSNDHAEPGSTSTCAISGTDCVCSTSVDLSQQTENTATYVVSGTTLKMGDDDQFDGYCISADTFTLVDAEHPTLRLILKRAN